MGTWVDLSCDEAPWRHAQEEVGVAIEVRTVRPVLSSAIASLLGVGEENLYG